MVNNCVGRHKQDADSKKSLVLDCVAILVNPTLMHYRIIAIPDLSHVPIKPTRTWGSRKICERVRDVFSPYEANQLV